ncbi:MAG TPA: DUF3761 domain-containing protein [Gemmatirosa sp.]
MRARLGLSLVAVLGSAPLAARAQAAPAAQAPTAQAPAAQTPAQRAAATLPAGPYKAATPGGTKVANVTCKDGTTGRVGRGACARHGGVGAVGAPAPGAAKAAAVASANPGGVAPAPTPQATAVAPGGLARRGVAVAPGGTRTPATQAAHASTGGTDDANPAGAVAQCKDGMYSHAKGHRGACSRHGGVAKWMA